LSWFIAAQGLQTDPDCNDYLTSKWLGLIRPLLAGFDRPLTLRCARSLRLLTAWKSNMRLVAPLPAAFMARQGRRVT